MIQQMATKETQIKPEAAEVLVEAVTCDTCGAPDTDSNPVNYRWSGSYGAAAFESGPPEEWMICIACESDEEVPF
jgi:hypothetical protein